MSLYRRPREFMNSLSPQSNCTVSPKQLQWARLIRMLGRKMDTVYSRNRKNLV